MDKLDIHVGDKVRIINYGHLIWEDKYLHPEPTMNFPIYYENEKRRWYDMNPELVGQEGTVDGFSFPHYSIDGIPGKHSWYGRDQLEKI